MRAECWRALLEFGGASSSGRKFAGIAAQRKSEAERARLLYKAEYERRLLARTISELDGKIHSPVSSWDEPIRDICAHDSQDWPCWASKTPFDPRHNPYEEDPQ
jgi:hypothetical protein